MISAKREARMRERDVREADFTSLRLLRFPSDVIGMGGMARVVKGVLKGAQGFERIVAVKELLPPYEDVAAYRQYLIAEGRILSQISHPNVVQVLGLTEQDGWSGSSSSSSTGESAGDDRGGFPDRPLFQS